jgi:hypothetical protein
MRLPRVCVFVALIAAGLALSVPAQAQDVRVGTRTGVVQSTLQGALFYPALGFEGGEVRTSRQTGMQVGGFVAVSLSDRLAVRAELQYAQKGAAIRGEWAGTCGSPLALCVRPSLRGTYRTSYVQLPVLLTWHQPLGHGLGLRLLAGPSVDLLVDTQIVTDNLSASALPQNALSPMSHETLGAVAGMEVQYDVSAAGALVLGGRYHPGVTEIDMLNVDSTIRSRAFVLSLGYFFRL